MSRPFGGNVESDHRVAFHAERREAVPWAGSVLKKSAN